jgi:hypothetical protein
MIGSMAQETDRKRGLRNPEPPPAKTCIETWAVASFLTGYHNDTSKVRRRKHVEIDPVTAGTAKPKDKVKRGRSPKAAFVTRQARLEMATAHCG